MSSSYDTLSLMRKSLATLPHVARAHYKISAKGGGIVPLDLTPIQLRVLNILEMLLEQRERARLVVVKPRQIRATTAFNAFEFKASQDIEALKTLIVTHKAKVSSEVFENIKRFHEQMPAELKQEMPQSNDYKIRWKNSSEVVVGTAGTDSARGFPCLILHLSELGRFKDRHVRDVQEGAMQAHASAERGSILLGESTSGGEGNYFHDIAKSGWRNPQSSWFTAFFGWHEMLEYQMKPPKGWVPDSEEVRIMKELNITVEQIYWRHVKLHDEMRGSLSAFQREYPATFEEAFSSAEGRLIDPVVLINALNSQTVVDKSQPLILGVDPAGQGDRTALIMRQGFVMFKPLIFRKMDDYTLTNIVGKIMDEHNVDHCFIDMGYGHGTYNNLRALGRRNVTGIHFGSSPSPENKQLYVNKRTEMAAMFQDWAEEGPDQMGGTAKIPDDPELLRDIRMIPELEYSGEAQKFKLATKEEIKENLGKSPDCFDAAILTFAHPVKSRNAQQALIQTVQQGSSILTTENDFRSFGGNNFQGQGQGQGQNYSPFYYTFGQQ